MSDFNLVTIYYILSETMGVWLWALIAIALVLLSGIIFAALRLNAARRGAGRPVTAAIIVGLVVTAIFTFLVPGWSHADLSALSGLADIVFAVLFALVPGGIAASLTFILVGLRCAGTGGRTPHLSS